MNTTAPIIVAEIGGNHRGEFSTACRMIEIIGSYCRELFDLVSEPATVSVKFQKRTPRLRPEDYERPHPNPYFAYGDSYGAHREALEFWPTEHANLKDVCEANGLIYSCSVWDSTAAQDIIDLEPQWIKIPSALNLDRELIGFVADNYGGDLHISLGMTTRSEVAELVEFLVAIDAAKRTVLYHCTSAYPAEHGDVRIDELFCLRKKYGDVIKGLGFSGHHRGIDIDMAAVVFGVDFIERHFTLDRTWRGTDHAASLEPDGLRKLIRGVRNVAAARGVKPAHGVLEAEEYQRGKLKEGV